VAEAVRAGRDVVVDHGLGRRVERDEWKQFIESLGASGAFSPSALPTKSWPGASSADAQTVTPSPTSTSCCPS
jgi:predicted kinase